MKFVKLPTQKWPICVALLLGGAAPPPKALAPSEIVATAPASEWVAIAAADMLVMDLAADRDGNKRRVVIQLMPPPFSQGWVGNIRKLAAAHWWDGLSVNRVQDNYVAQWGDANAEDKAKAKALPGGLVKVSESEYVYAGGGAVASAAMSAAGSNTCRPRVQPSPATPTRAPTAAMRSSSGLREARTSATSRCRCGWFGKKSCFARRR